MAIKWQKVSRSLEQTIRWNSSLLHSSSIVSWNIHKTYFIQPIEFYANDFAQLEIDFYLNCFLLNIERLKLYLFL